MNLLPLQPENAGILHSWIPEFDPEKDDLDQLRDIIADMEYSRKAYKALGLAANQVGFDRRVFVMGTEFANFVCINPKILEASTVYTPMNEGCLSFPRLVLKVQRPEWVKVSYLDIDLKEVTCTFKDNLAKCFQHELDHLNGITFNTKVSKLVLAMAAKKRAVKQRYR